MHVAHLRQRDKSGLLAAQLPPEPSDVTQSVAVSLKHQLQRGLHSSSASHNTSTGKAAEILSEDLVTDLLL